MLNPKCDCGKELYCNCILSEVIANQKTAEDNLKNLKASAKAKLIAGEPLTEAEADTLVI